MKKNVEEKVIAFANALIDQEKARIIVSPKKNSSGFWFGGASIIQDRAGTLYVSGRYRNFGDSREGLAKGERGLELAIFKSVDKGQNFNKVLSFSKKDLSGFEKVYSIEGTALNQMDTGEVELYISTEKAVPYPEEVKEYLKPGAGVWSIDCIKANNIEEFDPRNLKQVFKSDDPVNLHIKDPFIYKNPAGDTVLLFCTHPFAWSSSNTGYIIRPKGSETFGNPVYNIIPKGQTWDVSMARGTAFLDLKGIGVFDENSTVTLVFYDSAECLRNHKEHGSAKSRPRGYSCEELGGCGYFENPQFRDFKRLSLLYPMFVSPEGTGSSRYVDVLECDEGFYAVWQQSRKDFSQPLVMNFLPRKKAEELLS